MICFKVCSVFKCATFHIHVHVSCNCVTCKSSFIFNHFFFQVWHFWVSFRLQPCILPSDFFAVAGHPPASKWLLKPENHYKLSLPVQERLCNRITPLQKKHINASVAPVKLWMSSECVCVPLLPPLYPTQRGRKKALWSLLFIWSTKEPHRGFLPVSLSAPPISPL